MMDLSNSMQIVSSRIQEVEPEHASKIVGYLLLQDFGDQDMIRLAFSPDNVIRDVANKVKHTLSLSLSNQLLQWQQQQLQQLLQQLQQQQQQQMSFASVSSQLNNPIQYSNPYQGFPDFRTYSNSNMPLSASWNVQVANGLEEQVPRSLKFKDDYLKLGNSFDSELHSNYSYPDQPGFSGFATDRVSRRSRSLIEFPPKVCHYFSKGICKHGNNCRFYHSNPMTLESFSELLGLGSNDVRFGNGNGIDDHNMFPVGSLEKLELDLIELLRSRNGSPISIATLPMLYYDKFGRTLQAEGYLTESQRHGKAGYSLTRLLARLRNSICLIDRPHGQHSVILAEDAPKYTEYASDRSENGGIVPGSRQIYLTFPAESAFSEIDVSNYFNTYGPVQDVRIPSQERRMFGFVTFVYPETVRKILAKGNPHFVCGARVLVKPYREKSRLVDRNHAEKLQCSMHDSHLSDGDLEFQSLARASDYLRLMRQQFMEEHKEALEQEKACFSESQLLPEPSARLQYFANSIDELKLAQEFPTLEQFSSRLNDLNIARLQYFANSIDELKLAQEFPTLEQFSSRLNDLNIGFPSEDNFRNVNTNYDSGESNQVLNLPDNPFATSTVYDT